MRSKEVRPGNHKRLITLTKAHWPCSLNSVGRNIVWVRRGFFLNFERNVCLFGKTRRGMFPVELNFLLTRAPSEVITVF